MKANTFFDSLNNYTWKRLAALPIKWSWLGAGIISVLIFASMLTSKTSMTEIKDLRGAIELAAKSGDYKLAKELLLEQESSNNEKRVLGAESDLHTQASLEDLVYPENKIEREIAKYEKLNVEYPENRDILLALSRLYDELGNVEIANTYREQARILDPNNEIFK